MSVFDPDMDLCQCGHVRYAHEADADFVDGRYVGYWLKCSGQDERNFGTVACGCEKFHSNEED